jgi:hypothetical protein
MPRARLTRRSLVGLALAGAAALVPARALAAARRAPLVRGLAVRNAGRPFAGDVRRFATVSPGVPGRDAARVSFELDRQALVRLEAVRTARRRQSVVWATERTLDPGGHALRWQPDPATRVGSYVLRLTLDDGRGGRRTYGSTRPLRPERSRAAVVRVLGVEAAFARPSAAPLEPVRLTVAADCRRLTVQFLHCGTEPEYTDRTDEMRGLPVSEPFEIDWSRNRTTPAAITLRPGPWPSGVYGVRLETPDGRLGFAPFVLRPPELGAVREAVVVPTNTWQAYNFYDRDGDGWGDTWYAGGNPPVLLDRPYLERGVPPRYRRYDLPFLRWLRRLRHRPEFLSEDDLEAIPSGDDLRRLYDLVVFPGHTEYVTEHAYDVVERYRDLGGRLIFLSANNFFWRVDKRGGLIRRRRLWRALGRPESALCGVQYRANDDGSRQAPFQVVDAAAAPWLFAGTGLGNGSPIGDAVGGYGIEIDTTTEHSPPGTRVLARIPDLFGEGLSAEMAYYETDGGARVFSAGVLDFCGTVHLDPVRRLLDNLWRHMLRDVPPFA